MALWNERDEILKERLFGLTNSEGNHGEDVKELRYRPDLARLVSHWNIEGRGRRRLLSLLRGHRIKEVLKRILDETEFLSDYGVRAL